MTKDSFASVNGVPATSLRLVVGQIGPWVVDAVLEDDTPMEGRVVVRIREHQLSGTVSPNSGAFGLKRSLRIVAGANGWGRTLPAKTAKHNDAGVKAWNVASEVAQECGEAFGTFAPGSERVGTHYVRTEGTASGTLEDIIGEALWWVDYDGVTHVGTREVIEAHPSVYEVLEYNPRTSTVTLAVDDPLAIGVGSVISERLDAPQTVREFELTITADSMRVKAWCGGDEASRGSLSSALERVIESIIWRHGLPGVWRYRVVAMIGDRAHLQRVKRTSGLPDIVHVSLSPGLPGARIQLAEKSEVLVAFVDGQRSQPTIVGFAGKDGVGFIPDRLDFWLDVDAEGKPVEPTQEIARVDDPVEFALPPGLFTGTIATVPPTPLVNVPVNAAMRFTGKITGGSSRMKVGD